MCGSIIAFVGSTIALQLNLILYSASKLASIFLVGCFSLPAFILFNHHPHHHHRNELVHQWSPWRFIQFSVCVFVFSFSTFCIITSNSIFPLIFCVWSANAPPPKCPLSSRWSARSCPSSAAAFWAASSATALAHPSRTDRRCPMTPWRSSSPSKWRSNRRNVSATFAACCYLLILPAAKTTATSHLTTLSLSLSLFCIIYSYNSHYLSTSLHFFSSFSIYVWWYCLLPNSHSFIHSLSLNWITLDYPLFLTLSLSSSSLSRSSNTCERLLLLPFLFFLLSLFLFEPSITAITLAHFLHPIILPVLLSLHFLHFSFVGCTSNDWLLSSFLLSLLISHGQTHICMSLCVCQNFVLTPPYQMCVFSKDVFVRVLMAKHWCRCIHLLH